VIFQLRKKREIEVEIVNSAFEIWTWLGIGQTNQLNHQKQYILSIFSRDGDV